MFFIFLLFFKDYSLTSIVFVVTLFVNNYASDCYHLAIFVSVLPCLKDFVLVYRITNVVLLLIQSLLRHRLNTIQRSQKG